MGRTSRGERASDGANTKYRIKYQPSNPNLYTYNEGLSCQKKLKFLRLLPKTPSNTWR